jgi:hypothetical protein
MGVRWGWSSSQFSLWTGKRCLQRSDSRGLSSHRCLDYMLRLAVRHCFVCATKCIHETGVWRSQQTELPGRPSCALCLRLIQPSGMLTPIAEIFAGRFKETACGGTYLFKVAWFCIAFLLSAKVRWAMLVWVQ